MIGPLIRAARLLAIAVVVGAVPGVCAAQQQAKAEVPTEGSCPPFYGRWAGPYDYRHPPTRAETSAVLSQVEALHFSPEIERLQGDLEKNNTGAQIEHVLLVYPNHHRALVSLSRLAQKTRGEHRKIQYFTISCLFVRAVTFAPDDAVVRGIYGVHLSNFGRKKEALAQLLEAERLGAQDANTLYNIGLLYLESRDFDKSLDYAKKAYGAGFPLPGLRNRLQAAGKWQE